MPTEAEILNNLTDTIIHAAIEVHKTLGINFNVQMLRSGIRRLVNNFPEEV